MKAVKAVISIILCLMLSASLAAFGAVESAQGAVSEQGIQKALDGIDMSSAITGKERPELAGEFSSEPEDPIEGLKSAVGAVPIILGNPYVYASVKGDDAKAATAAGWQGVQSYLEQNSVLSDRSVLNRPFAEAYVDYCIEEGLLSSSYRSVAISETLANFASFMSIAANRGSGLISVALGGRRFNVMLTGERAQQLQSYIDNACADVCDLAVKHKLSTVLNNLVTDKESSGVDAAQLSESLYEKILATQEQLSYSANDADGLIMLAAEEYVANELLPALEALPLDANAVASQLKGGNLAAVRFALSDTARYVAIGAGVACALTLALMWLKRGRFLLWLALGGALGGAALFIARRLVNMAFNLDGLIALINTISPIKGLGAAVGALADAVFASARQFGICTLAAAGIALAAGMIIALVAKGKKAKVKKAQND